MRVVFEFEDEIRWLEGEYAEAWGNGAAAQDVLAGARGIHGPEEAWQSCSKTDPDVEDFGITEQDLLDIERRAAAAYQGPWEFFEAQPSWRERARWSDFMLL